MKYQPLSVTLRRITMVDLSYNRNSKELDFVNDSAWTDLTHTEINVNGPDLFTRILYLCMDVSTR
jgi:hypothetical protein